MSVADKDRAISVRFTRQELYELDCLLANGVCDYEDPSNKMAASAYRKIGKALHSRRAPQSLKETP